MANKTIGTRPQPKVDPYAAIRTLRFKRALPYDGSSSGNSESDSGVSSPSPTGERPSPYHTWAPTGQGPVVGYQGEGDPIFGKPDWGWKETFDYGFDTPDGAPPPGFQSKYGRVASNPDGSLNVRLQRPGMHKYDTMDAVYRIDPQTGQYVLQGDPTARRETSYGEEFRDNAELAGKGVLAAGALYAAGYGLSSALGAGGVEGLGAEALGEAGGYGFTSAEAAGTAEGLGSAAGSFAGDLGVQELPQGLSGLQNTGAEIGGSPASANGPYGTEFGNPGLADVAKGVTGAMEARDWINLGGLVYSIANKPKGVNTSALDAQAARNGAIADRQQTLAEKQYADQMAIFEQFRPMLVQQMQGSLTDQNLSRDRSSQQWDDYMKTWRPVEQSLADKSLNWATPGRMQSAADEASSAVAGQQDANRTAGTADMIRAGLDPSSIAALNASGRVGEAKDRAGAATNARRTVETQGMGYLEAAARFGRNTPTTGLAAAQLGGQQGQQVQQGYTGLVNASGTPAAAANPLFTSAVNTGNNAAQLFQNSANLQQQNQQQQYNWGMNTIGGLNQWAGNRGGFTGSSKKTKDRKGKVDGKDAADAVEKSGAENWSYKPGLGDGDTKDRMGPMAEDLQRVAPTVSDGKRIDNIAFAGLHHASIGHLNKTVKQQSRKIAALERKLSLADA